MEVKVHPLTNNPTEAWEKFFKKQKFFEMRNKIPLQTVKSDKIRVVCMSDTHSFTNKIKFDIPNGDILIHAGDFSKCGGLNEIILFNEWLGKLPHKYKIVIAGNHELSFDQNFLSPQQFRDMSNKSQNTGFRISKKVNTYLSSNVNAKSLLSNCLYLEDSGAVLYGLKFYGTPWQPEFCNWAFNLPRGEKCLEKWNLIPNDTDVLVTHTPPLGQGDFCCTGVRAGCVELLTTVQQRVKPRYHIFGHIHEGYGVTSDGTTIFINASTCNKFYSPVNHPIVFDIPFSANE